MNFKSTRTRVLIGGVVLALLVVGVGAFVALSTWGNVHRVSIDRPSDADASGGPVAQEDEGQSDGRGQNSAIDEPEVAPGRQVFLLVGSDSREDLTDTSGFGDFAGKRADVVMVLIKDGSKTGILSLPRDLWVDNPCTGVKDRINDMLEGCDQYNGPTLLTLAVEDITGLAVDHFALIDLAGFQGAVDALGGYEICVDNPVRDSKARLSLPAGCTLADGEQTLAWMRSRHTQELTDNGWRIVPGMNDLVRNERQRTFLITMLGRMSDISSPQAMAAAAREVAPFVTVDSDLSLIRAANLAWTLRGLASGDIEELDVPVHDATTEAGAAVLLPSTPIDEIVSNFLTTAATGTGVVLGITP